MVQACERKNCWSLHCPTFILRFWECLYNFMYTLVWGSLFLLASLVSIVRLFDIHAFSWLNFYLFLHIKRKIKKRNFSLHMCLEWVFRVKCVVWLILFGVFFFIGSPFGNFGLFFYIYFGFLFIEFPLWNRKNTLFPCHR